MKNIIIIISQRKLKAGLILLVFLILLIIFSIILTFTISNLHAALNILPDDTMEELKKENERLKGVIGSILPDMEKSLFESDCLSRHYYKPAFETVPPAQVISEGKSLPFKVLVNNPDYLRPIYDSSWKSFYFRGWIDLPHRMCDARHNLFVFYGGASSLFDFYGEQSLNIEADIDYHRNINFLVYDFQVKDIKILDHQILLIGEPQIAGMQIAAVRVNDVLPKEVDSRKYLFQLSTPSGYEIDDLYGGYGRSDYLKKIEPLSTSTLTQNQDEPSLIELKKENELLKKELSYYVPLEEEIRITEEYCPDRLMELILKNKHISENIQEKRVEIPFHVHYSNAEYKRPIYHPSWKKNYTQGWAYVPEKICEALHDLFIIPNDKKKQWERLGTLAFFEKFRPMDESQIGLLVYDFDVKHVEIFDAENFVIGFPSRTGAQIISIDQKYLKNNQDYIFYLETLDGFQTDLIILNSK